MKNYNDSLGWIECFGMVTMPKDPPPILDYWKVLQKMLKKQERKEKKKELIK